MSDDYPPGPLTPEELERAWKASESFWRGIPDEDRPTMSKEWYMRLAQLRETIQSRSQGFGLAASKGKNEQAEIWIKLKSSKDPAEFIPILDAISSVAPHLVLPQPFVLKGRVVKEITILILDLVREGSHSCRDIKKKLAEVDIVTTTSAIGHHATILVNLGLVRREVTKREDGKPMTRYYAEERADAETTKE